MAEARLNALQRREKTLQQDKVGAQAETTSALEEYAKMSCRQLCDEVYNAFPREIRDMIYGYLHEGEKNEVPIPDNSCHRTTNYFSSTSASQFSPGHVGNLDTRDRCDHWWCREYLGDIVQRELAEHFFRTLFCFGFNLESMAGFRIKD